MDDNEMFSSLYRIQVRTVKESRINTSHGSICHGYNISISEVHGRWEARRRSKGEVDTELNEYLHVLEGTTLREALLTCSS